MHYLETDEKTRLLNQEIPPGRYYCECSSLPIFYNIAPARESYKIHDFPNRFDPDADYNGKTIGVIRPGGHGDLLFMTPLLRAMKQRWPEATIKLYVFDHFSTIVFPNELGIERGVYPMDKEEFEALDGVFWPEGAVERSEEAKTTHMVDLFASLAGIPLTDGKHCTYTITEDEREWVRENIAPTNRPRIAAQLRASANCRTYPAQLMVKALEELANKFEYQIVIFGNPGEHHTIEEANDKIINLSKRRTPFRKSMAVLETCDATLGPDSVLIHVAGALGIEAVGLYGPFDWKLRTKYAPTVRALQGHAPCAPCFHHARPGLDFPENMPCASDGVCRAMASIPPDRIVREVRKAVERSQKSALVAA